MVGHLGENRGWNTNIMSSGFGSQYCLTYRQNCCGIYFSTLFLKLIHYPVTEHTILCNLGDINYDI